MITCDTHACERVLRALMKEERRHAGKREGVRDREEACEKERWRAKKR